MMIRWLEDVSLWCRRLVFIDCFCQKSLPDVQLFRFFIDYCRIWFYEIQWLFLLVGLHFSAIREIWIWLNFSSSVVTFVKLNCFRFFITRLDIKVLEKYASFSDKVIKNGRFEDSVEFLLLYFDFYEIRLFQICITLKKSNDV